MTMRPDEIVAILRRQIQELATELKIESEGTVLTVGDGIARVYGLEKAMAGELLEFPQERPMGWCSISRKITSELF